MSTFFVTASGTAIGKTAICTSLLRALRSEGRSCSAYKPVVTGYDPEASADSDTGRLLTARALPLTEANLAAVSPWRFREPLSPDVAARRENREIDFAALVRFCRNRGGDGITLIEGIGGVMVPLTDRETVLDWIVALDAPTVLVVGSYLGSLSHTLTAVHALSMAGVELAAIAVNRSEIEPMPPTETAAAISRFAPGIPIDVIERTATGDALDVRALSRRLNPYLTKKESPPAGEVTGGDKPSENQY